MDQLWHPKSLPGGFKTGGVLADAMPESKKNEFFSEVKTWQDNLKKLSKQIQDLNKGAECMVPCRNAPESCVIVAEALPGRAGTREASWYKGGELGKEECILGQRSGLSMVNFDPSILESSVAK